MALLGGMGRRRHYRFRRPQGTLSAPPSGIEPAWERLVDAASKARPSSRVLLAGPPGNGQAELAAHLAKALGARHMVWDAAAWEEDRDGAAGSLDSLRRHLDGGRGRALLEIRGLECAPRVAPGFPAYLAGWLDGLEPATVVLAPCGDGRLPHALAAVFGNDRGVVVEVGPPGPGEILAMARDRLAEMPPPEAARLAGALAGLCRDDVTALLDAVAAAPGAWEDVLAGRGVAVLAESLPVAGGAAAECPLCCMAVEEAEAVTCPECGTVHHKKCWEENGGCTTYGCGVVG